MANFFGYQPPQNQGGGFQGGQNFGGYSQPGSQAAPGLPPSTGSSFIPGEAQSVYTPAFAIPGYEATQQRMRTGAQQAAARGPSQFQGGQADLISMLQAQAQGQGPSVAQGQLKQATDRNLAQAMAMGASQAGYQPGAAVQRQVLNQAGQIGQEAAGQSGILRAQEIMGAREQLAGALGQARQQDQALMDMNDRMVAFYESQGMNLDLAQAKAAQDLQALMTGKNVNMENIRSQERVGREGVAAQREASSKSLIGSIFSDWNLKKDIVANEEDLHNFLDFLGGE